MPTTQVGCRESSGFTLFELLVVILIIGLISALVIPRMVASLPGVQLKSTARAVAASLRHARSKAVFESTPYVAIFDKTRKLLAVEPVSEPIHVSESDKIKGILNASELHNAYGFPDGIDFDVLNSNDADEDGQTFPIFFFPRGDSTGGDVVLRNLRHKQYTIKVDRITGTVEVDRL